jgi:hypothetical protein
MEYSKKKEKKNLHVIYGVDKTKKNNIALVLG